ncbi:MAG: DUF3793 family protein [Lachnospiraceae bacterium]|nr:DUF3793 family protein [Lachnospiraceae bacterium]
MSEELIVDNCSPTLAGIKTGNLFSVKITEGTDIISEVRRLNCELRKKGIRVIPLKKTKEYALIYLYRPKYLKRDLDDPEAVRILRKRGYHCDSPERCIVRLIERLKEDNTFPHEIGLFLGYPPSDVACFIKHPCEGVKCCGCWKAFSKPDAARKTFSRFEMCTKAYRQMNRQGKSLTQLAVRTV